MSYYRDALMALDVLAQAGGDVHRLEAQIKDLTAKLDAARERKAAAFAELKEITQKRLDLNPGNTGFDVRFANFLLELRSLIEVRAAPRIAVNMEGV